MDFVFKDVWGVREERSDGNHAYSHMKSDIGWSLLLFSDDDLAEQHANFIGHGFVVHHFEKASELLDTLRERKAKGIQHVSIDCETGKRVLTISIDEVIEGIKNHMR